MNNIFKSSNEETKIENNAPSPTIDLSGMSDDEIKQLIAQSYKLLDSRKREREKQVKEQIRQMAIKAGIKVSFRDKTTRKNRSKTANQTL